jgi:hypothetical protein
MVKVVSLLLGYLVASSVLGNISRVCG